MKTYLYVDAQNFVVYADFKDSPTNRRNSKLKSYEMHWESVGLFFRYFRLKIHPKAKQNIIK